MAELEDAELIRDAADGGEHAGERGERRAEGIGDGLEAVVEEDFCAGAKGAELECVVIEYALGFGIGGEEDLEAAIESEAVDYVGADASAGGVGGFENAERDAALLEAEGAAEAGDSGSDNSNFRRRHLLPSMGCGCLKLRGARAKREGNLLPLTGLRDTTPIRDRFSP